MALIVPDICGSLEVPGPGKSRERYVNWCRIWLEPKYTFGPHVFLSGSDCYQLRCSLVHSGRSDIEPKKKEILDKFEFFVSGSHCNWVEGNVHNGIPQPNFLQLRVDKFSEDMFDAAEAWDDAMQNNPDVQNQKRALLKIHTSATVFGGIRIG